MIWKALTLVQPMASAIAEPSPNPKRVENRSAPIARNIAPCWLGLHAGKSYDDQYADFIERILGDHCLRWVDRGKCPQGAMLGAMFVDWVEPFPAGDLSQRAASVSDLPARDRLLLADHWAFGPWCLHVAEVRLLPAPVPCRGMLGLWPVPTEIADLLDELVPERR